jgi:hypothetical protein
MIGIAGTTAEQKHARNNSHAPCATLSKYTHMRNLDQTPIWKQHPKQDPTRMAMVFLSNGTLGNAGMKSRFL